MPDGVAPIMPGFSETHRAMLRVAAEAYQGSILPRHAVLAALHAARVPAPPHPAPPLLHRLRNCAQDGRQCIMVWQDEAEALLALIADAQPPAPVTLAADAPAPDALRTRLIGLAQQCFGHAHFAGHDAGQRDALNRLGMDLLDLAASVPAAPDAVVQAKARQLFGALPEGAAA